MSTRLAEEVAGGGAGGGTGGVVGGGAGEVAGGGAGGGTGVVVGGGAGEVVSTLEENIILQNTLEQFSIAQTKLLKVLIQNILSNK